MTIEQLAHVYIACILAVVLLGLGQIAWDFRKQLLAWLKRDPQVGANKEHCLPNWMRLSLYPDFIIGGAKNPYLKRWYLTPRLPLWVKLLVVAVGLWLHHPIYLLALFGAFLHQIIRSDDDRALHDHPWMNVSIILKGWYREFVPDFSQMEKGDRVVPTSPGLRHLREAGDIVPRWATNAHRIEIIESPCWSLFLIGPQQRSWGFLCFHGWRHHKEFVGEDSGTIGRGCE